MKKNELKTLIRYELKNYLITEEYADQYKISGILITDTTQRGQQEILSDIRSLTGVTIVSTEDIEGTYSQDNSNLRVKANIKIDGYPFIRHGGFGKESIRSIISSIKRIKGVKSFIVNSEDVKRI
jgi:hypothetical protein